MRFNEARLAEPIARPVAAEGYTTPTPIQTKAMPAALAGKNVLVATPGRVGDSKGTAATPYMRADSDESNHSRLLIEHDDCWASRASRALNARDGGTTDASLRVTLTSLEILS